MMAKISAEPLLGQSLQEKVSCCPCTEDSVLEQNVGFCQDPFFPVLLIALKKASRSSALKRQHLVQFANILHYHF